MVERMEVGFVGKWVGTVFVIVQAPTFRSLPHSQSQKWVGIMLAITCFGLDFFYIEPYINFHFAFHSSKMFSDYCARW